MVSLVD